MLQWARANGCDWDGSTCNGALNAGEAAGWAEVLEWALAHGCEFSGDDEDGQGWPAWALEIFRYVFVDA